MRLMSEQEELGKQMAELTKDDDFGMDADDNADNVCNIIDLSDNEPSPIKKYKRISNEE